MSDELEIEVDYTQGNQILRNAYHLVFPEKVGERTFSPKVRQNMMGKVRRLVACFRAVSPIMQEERVLYAGPREGYVEQDLTQNEKERLEAQSLAISEDRVEKKFKLVNPRATYKVVLNKKAQDALYWLLYLYLAQDSKMILPAGQQDDIAWPLAEKIGARESLEKETDANTKESIEVVYDKDLEKPKKPELQKVD